MRTVEYLDAIQRKFNLPSDYAISKMLGITRGAVSQYRQGRGYFSDEIARRVAVLLEVHPGIVLLDVYAERAHEPELRSILEDVIKGFRVPSLHAKRSRALALSR